MAMIIKQESLNMIDDAFIKLQENINDKSAIDNISKALKELTKKDISITLYESKHMNDIMSVYPNESDMEKMIDIIINNESDQKLVSLWEDIDKWTIEINVNILKTNMNLNNKELTSLLLHEVGHVVYSNSTVMKISKYIRVRFMKMQRHMKDVFSNKIFKVYLFPAILNACDFKSSNIKSEIIADNYAKNAGYGEYLSSAMNKVFNHIGSKSSNMKNETDELMNFSIDTLSQLEKRNERLVGNTLSQLKSKVYSPIGKHVVDRMANVSIMNETTEHVKLKAIRDTFDKIHMEYSMNMYKENVDLFSDDNGYYTEGLFNRVVTMKRIDPADLDYISIEEGNINNNDDKMMLVSYIYSKLDIIEYYISIIDSKNTKYRIPHSRESLIQMKDRLEKTKDKIINKKIPEITYGINIAYPSGYEG